MKQKKVAVIILNYNGVHLLDESLGSLLKQDYPNYQIYLADDASTDNSLEYVKKNYPTIKILASPKNRGTAGVSNFAAGKVTEPYLIFVSNDMFFYSKMVSSLVNALETLPQAGLCTAVLLHHQKDPKVKDFVIDNAGFDLDIFGFIRQKYPLKRLADIPKTPFPAFASCGGCYIIRRSLYQKLGGFDESFWSLSEDMDLSWRIRLSGYQIYTQPQAFLLHHVSKTLSQLKKYRTRYLSERNNLTMILKNYSLRYLIFILPLYFIVEILEIIYHTIISRDPRLAFSVIRAIFYNLKFFPQTFKKRRLIQANRVTPDSQIFPLLFKGSFKFAMALGKPV